MQNNTASDKLHNNILTDEYLQEIPAKPFNQLLKLNTIRSGGFDGKACSTHVRAENWYKSVVKKYAMN
jgi:hypothetical protein